MNVLITGVNGFVGSNLKQYLLKNDYRVLELSRTKSTNLPLSDSFTWNELSEIEAHSPDVFIHLAGKAHDLKNTSQAEEYFTVNTGLTKKLFDLFIQSKAKDFIYFSSVKAVADVVEGTLDENAKAWPKTAYGQSKLQAEEYIMGSKLPEGKRLFILRPCMIHGPGNKGNFNLLYQLIKKRVPYPLGSFENKRSYLSIQNLCFIIHQILLDPSVSGGIYNMADDESLSTNELIRLIGKEIKISPSLWKINPAVVKALARFGDQLRLPFNSERLQKLTENYVVSNSKIKSALNVQSLPISSREGFSITISSFSKK